ncbi:hypothetical protein [Streptomyces sp. NPDC000410]|uniref:hypothetical protein n=1 Tax=Streptomyces sp. NPDC000410 TaxID=3154254 RepID=UPI00331EFA6A
MIGVGDYVVYEPYGLGTGVVVMDLGGDMVRVRFARREASVLIDRPRPATEDEKAAAIAAGILPKP